MYFSGHYMFYFMTSFPISSHFRFYMFIIDLAAVLSAMLISMTAIHLFCCCYCCCKNILSMALLMLHGSRFIVSFVFSDSFWTKKKWQASNYHHATAYREEWTLFRYCCIIFAIWLYAVLIWIRKNTEKSLGMPRENRISRVIWFVAGRLHHFHYAQIDGRCDMQF